MKYGNGITPKRGMWCEIDRKRKCSTCDLFETSKTGVMSCIPVGIIKEPDVIYCSFHNLKALVLKMNKGIQ